MGWAVRADLSGAHGLHTFDRSARPHPPYALTCHPPPVGQGPAPSSHSPLGWPGPFPCHGSARADQGASVTAQEVAPEAASAMRAATSAGLDTYTLWLAAVSATVAPARSAMARWAGGGIMRSSPATR